MTKLVCTLFGIWCAATLPEPTPHGVFKDEYDTHCFCGFHTEYCPPPPWADAACCHEPDKRLVCARYKDKP